MSWLRIDDSFGDHPKLLGLPPKDRWTWVTVLCYCARHSTAGHLPPYISQAVRGATSPFLRRCADLGLLDPSLKDGCEYVVHDWPLYNADTVAEKVDYYFARFPEASANDCYRAIGGKRDLVLEEVRRWHETGPQTVPLNGSLPGSPSGTREPPNPVPSPVPKAVHARALPSPTPTPTPRGSSSVSETQSSSLPNGASYESADNGREGRKEPITSGEDLWN